MLLGRGRHPGESTSAALRPSLSVLGALTATNCCIWHSVAERGTWVGSGRTWEWVKGGQNPREFHPETRWKEALV